MTNSPITADEVRTARAKASLSQSEAAHLIHVSVDTWKQWESGRRTIHPAFFELFTIKAAKKRK